MRRTMVFVVHIARCFDEFDCEGDPDGPGGEDGLLQVGTVEGPAHGQGGQEVAVLVVVGHALDEGAPLRVGGERREEQNEERRDRPGS